MACNLYQNKEEGKTFNYYAENFQEKNTPGTLCLRTRSAPGTLYLNAQSTQGTQIKLYEFLQYSKTQIKSARSTPGPQTKRTRCAPGH